MNEIKYQKYIVQDNLENINRLEKIKPENISVDGIKHLINIIPEAKCRTKSTGSAPVAFRKIHPLISIYLIYIKIVKKAFNSSTIQEPEEKEVIEGDNVLDLIDIPSAVTKAPNKSNNGATNTHRMKMTKVE